jgi:hypothetical protein
MAIAEAMAKAEVMVKKVATARNSKITGTMAI